MPVAPDGWPRAVGFLADNLVAGQYLPDSEMDRFSLLLQIEEAMKEEELERIVAIDLGDPIEIWLLYDGRVAIELGSRMDIEYKILSANNVIKSSVNEDFVGQIDVTTRPIARLREINIYTQERWPMSPTLLEDYKRAL